MTWEQLDENTLTQPPYMLLRIRHSAGENTWLTYIALKQCVGGWLMVGETGYDNSKEAIAACRKDQGDELDD